MLFRSRALSFARASRPLPNVDGTPKYYQNALEVAVGSCTLLGHARPNTSKAFWQYFGVPSTLGSGLLARAKLSACAKPRVPRYAIRITKSQVFTKVYDAVGNENVLPPKNTWISTPVFNQLYYSVRLLLI